MWRSCKRPLIDKVRDGTGNLWRHVGDAMDGVRSSATCKFLCSPRTMTLYPSGILLQRLSCTSHGLCCFSLMIMGLCGHLVTTNAQKKKSCHSLCGGDSQAWMMLQGWHRPAPASPVPAEFHPSSSRGICLVLVLPPAALPLAHWSRPEVAVALAAQKGRASQRMRAEAQQGERKVGAICMCGI